jgi:hypothetical protein
MANRMFSERRLSLEKEVVDLYANVSVGETGAPTLVRGKGIASVVRDSAGLYTITLSDKYNALLGATVTCIVPSGVQAAPNPQVVSEAVATDKTVVIQFNDLSTPSATDPASGESFLVHLALSNSSAF